MHNIRNTAFIVTQSILSDVQKQAEEEYHQKQKERQTKIQTPQANVRQPRTNEPYIPREKVARERQPRPLTPFQEALQSDMPFSLQPEGQRIKNEIVITGNKDINVLTENVSIQDRELVTNAIERYNDRGVGQFKRLTYLGEEDPRFTLRVNTGSGGGGIRVLMREVPNPIVVNKIRKFEIIDIDYRKNIYRKRGL